MIYTTRSLNDIITSNVKFEPILLKTAIKAGFHFSPAGDTPELAKKASEGRLLNEKELKDIRNVPDWERAEKLLELIRKEKITL